MTNFPTLEEINAKLESIIPACTICGCNVKLESQSEMMYVCEGCGNTEPILIES